MYRPKRIRSGPERKPADYSLRRARTTPSSGDEQPGGPSRLKWLAIGAVITASIGWFVPSFSPYDAIRAAVDAVRPDPDPPSISEAIVSDYMAETRQATFWTRPPVVYPQGAEGFRRRFRAYDPRRPHAYRRLRDKVYIPDLIHAAPAFAGQDVEVLGRVVSSNLLRPIGPRVGEWVIQLAPMTVDRGIVYCRVTAPLRRHPYPAGRHLVARAMLIASGAVDLARGGFEHAVYMACSSVQRPYGTLGVLTRFVERARIDLVALHKKADDAREAATLWRAEVRRALRNDPALVDLTPQHPVAEGAATSSSFAR